MINLRYQPEIKAVLDPLLLSIPGVKAGHMFGHPAYSIGGKMFACLVRDGVTIKLPAETIASLLDGRIFTPFAPADGRPMNGWVKITRRPHDYTQDEPLFQQSDEYVLEQAHAGLVRTT